MHETNRILRPFDPSAPATSWLHPEDSARSDGHGRRYPTGLIYRFYDRNQELIYIGQTTSSHTYPIRWTAHRASSAWWGLVAYYSIDRVTSNNADLLALEKAAIRAEKPRFNKQHTRSRSSFMVLTGEGPAAVIEQFRTHLLPEDFAELAEAFAVEAALAAEVAPQPEPEPEPDRAAPIYPVFLPKPRQRP